MAARHLNPPGLMKPVGYSHVVVARGGRTVYVAGQGAFDTGWQLIGRGDHYTQTRQAYRNLVAALAAADARPADVVKSTIYLADASDAAIEQFTRAMYEALDGQPMPPTASTLVGVTRLGVEGMLVEIDAIAVVPDRRPAARKPRQRRAARRSRA
jgi:enamine deaminase RidA (YjgF/YER057c/UK114 family)